MSTDFRLANSNGVQESLHEYLENLPGYPQDNLLDFVPFNSEFSLYSLITTGYLKAAAETNPRIAEELNQLPLGKLESQEREEVHIQLRKLTAENMIGLTNLRPSEKKRKKKRKHRDRDGTDQEKKERRKKRKKPRHSSNGDVEMANGEPPRKKKKREKGEKKRKVNFNSVNWKSLSYPFFFKNYFRREILARRPQ